MPTPTFTPPPTPVPSTADPANFDTRADEMMAWFPTHTEEEEQFVDWLADLGDTYALSLSGASTTSLTIGTGSKTLTTQSGLGYRIGVTIYVSDPDGNQMWGPVTAYSGTTLTFDSIGVQGSGSGTSWTIGPALVSGVRANPTQSPTVAKGNSGTGTVTFTVAEADYQTVTNTGAFTIALVWPAGKSEICIEITNAGANAITTPTVNWLKGDGTKSTTFSSMGVTLQASGRNYLYLWSDDGGTTVDGRAA